MYVIMPDGNGMAFRNYISLITIAGVCLLARYLKNDIDYVKDNYQDYYDWKINVQKTACPKFPASCLEVYSEHKDVDNGRYNKTEEEL